MLLLIRYEEAISGVFKYLINKFPDAYLHDKTITYTELMTMNSDIKDVKEKFLEKEIDEIMRQPISDWYNIFITRHKAKFDKESINFTDFKEIYYRRNLVVHNQSIVNDVYLSNTSTSFKKGEKVEVDKEYLEVAFKFTEMVVYDTF